MTRIIEIKTTFIKLDSFLKFAGAVGDGSDAKRLIAEGLVSVDGEVCLMRGKKLYNGTVVEITSGRGSVSYAVSAPAEAAE